MVSKPATNGSERNSQSRKIQKVQRVANSFEISRASRLCPTRTDFETANEILSREKEQQYNSNSVTALLLHPHPPERQELQCCRSSTGHQRPFQSFQLQLQLVGRVWRRFPIVRLRDCLVDRLESRVGERRDVLRESLMHEFDFERGLFSSSALT